MTAVAPSREVKILVSLLANSYPRQVVTAANLDAYAVALADLPPPLLERAIHECVRENDWLPPASKVRLAAAELHLGLPTEAEVLAQIDARMAWARLPEDERGDAPEVHPLALQALATVGGWHSFRSAEDAKIIRGQYGRIFRDLRGAAVRQFQVGAAP